MNVLVEFESKIVSKNKNLLWPKGFQALKDVFHIDIIQFWVDGGNDILGNFVILQVG